MKKLLEQMSKSDQSRVTRNYVHYDYEELTPGPVVRTTGEVIQYIRETEKEFDPERIRAFRNKFMSACDGHATDRLIELVTERRH